MKTITISVDDETYRRCRARAEAAGRPVAEMVGTWLTDWTGKPAASDAEQECSQEKMFQVLADIHAAAKARWDGSPRPEKLTRDELHDRNALPGTGGRVMKTITISVDDETYRRCCARAAAAGRPVEEIVGSWLTDWTGKPAVSDAEQERAKQELYDILASIAARRQADGEVFRVADNLTREQLHDRDALR